MRYVILAVVLVCTVRGTTIDNHGVRGIASAGLPAKQSIPTPARTVLDHMTFAERKNSHISVEFESSNSDDVLFGREVERLWNDGKYDAALEQLTDLEARVGHVAIGNSWRKPVPTHKTSLWGSDVRIGDRDSLMDVALCLDTASGNLFAVLRHADEAPHWSICMSVNNGLSWDETFAWVGSHPTSIDGAAFSGHVYVAYNSPWEDARQVRARRFRCSDGSADTFHAGVVWTIACHLDTGDTMREVSLVSGRNDSCLYLYTLTSGGNVWSCRTCDDWDFWNQGRMITSYASSGLDGTANNGLSSTCNFLSYYDASDTLRIYRCSVGGNQLSFSLFAGNGSSTSISAYRDTVICAYEDGTSSPHQVRYATRYGDGDTWTIGTLSNADTAAEFPAITACGGGRFGATYRHCAPTGQLQFVERTDNGPWNDPVSIADNEPYSSRPGIVCLGAGVYGVAYLAESSPGVRGAFLDRSDWPYGLAEQRQPQASDCTPLATVVRGVLFLPSSLLTANSSLLSIDGRKVLDLRPGANDVRALAPGIYFVRSGPSTESRQPSAVTKVVLTS